MVFANADKDLKVVIVNCDCGCEEEIHIKKYVYEEPEVDNDYYISISESKFYSMQGGILHRIGHRLKCIWRAIRGKEYLLCDINIKEENIDELISKLEEIKK